MVKVISVIALVKIEEEEQVIYLSTVKYFHVNLQVGCANI